jgi:hypothetical protein
MGRVMALHKPLAPTYVLRRDPSGGAQLQCQGPGGRLVEPKLIADIATATAPEDRGVLFKAPAALAEHGQEYRNPFADKTQRCRDGYMNGAAGLLI